MTAGLHFRRMEERDITAVSEMEQELFSMPWSPQGFLTAMEQDTLFLVAEEAHTIVGYCGMYCSFEEGEITNVGVSSARQNEGIGRAMLQQLIAKAAGQGIRRIILEVRLSNEPARHLYESLGFQSCGVRRGFYDMPKEDGIVMLLERQ